MEGQLSEKALLYFGLYNEMMAYYRANDFEACDRLAGSLLRNADLPVLIRARCYMILSTAGREPLGIFFSFSRLQWLWFPFPRREWISFPVPRLEWI
jgi:hypothetical protein